MTSSEAIKKLAAELKSPTLGALLFKLIKMFPALQLKGYDHGAWFVFDKQKAREGLPIGWLGFMTAILELKRRGYISTCVYKKQHLCRIHFDRIEP